MFVQASEIFSLILFSVCYQHSMLKKFYWINQKSITKQRLENKCFLSDKNMPHYSRYKLLLSEFIFKNLHNTITHTIMSHTIVGSVYSRLKNKNKV